MSLPPLYEDAVRKDHSVVLRLVANHLYVEDLKNSCLVSRNWRDIFQKKIWENPAEYVRERGQWSIFRSFDTMKEARRYDAMSMIDTIVGPWLSADYLAASVMCFEFLIDLESVRFLILDQFLLPRGQLNYVFERIKSRPLLLSMAGLNPPAWRKLVRGTQDEEDVVSNIVFLNLSGNPSLPRMLQHGRFDSLRVLRLRHCRLDDEILERIVMCLTPLQLSSLDVGDNELTDNSLQTLCSLLYGGGTIKTYQPEMQLTELPPTYGSRGQEQPVPDTAKAFIEYAKEQPYIDVPRLGLTHLYLSGNKFTHNTPIGIFLRASKLQVFDIDAPLLSTSSEEHPLCHFLHPAAGVHHLVNNKDIARFHRGHTASYPVQLLSAMTSYKMQPTLKSLRVHHSFVTSRPSLPAYGVATPEEEGTHRPSSRRNAFSSHLYTFAPAPPPSPSSIDGDPDDPPPYAQKPPLPSSSPSSSSSPQDQNVTPKPPFPTAFSPRLNPHLTSLTLTNVPRHAPRLLIESLLAFIHGAGALSTDLSTLRARLPTGRRAPKVLPGLKEVVLEFERRNQYLTTTNTASVSEDPDAENFVAALANDFSFFNVEEEEKQGKVQGCEKCRGKGKEKELDGERLLDVHKCLSAYRMDKVHKCGKGNMLCREGVRIPWPVVGWEGVVTIIRY